MAFLQDKHPVDVKNRRHSKWHQINFLLCQSNQNTEQAGTSKNFPKPKGLFISKMKDESSTVEDQKTGEACQCSHHPDLLVAKLDIGESHNVMHCIWQENWHEAVKTTHGTIHIASTEMVGAEGIANTPLSTVGARFKGNCQSRGIQDSGYVNKYPGSSELDADVKDP